MLQDAKKAGIMYDQDLDPDIRSLRQTIVYGLKGIMLIILMQMMLLQQLHALLKQVNLFS